MPTRAERHGLCILRAEPLPMSDPGSFFRKVLPWAMLSLLLVLQGCITIEENYTFKKDGSGAMEYVVDMSELADLMKGLPGAKDKGDGMGKLDLIENIAKLKAITGISKVKVKKEKDGFIQRLSFRFTDVAALNGALNEIISDSTGTGPKEFFRWEGSTLVARTKGRTKGMGNSMGGGSEDSTGAEGMLKMMNARLAGGRLIMALAVGGEDRQLQAYGASLAQLAYDDLNRIVGGSVLLGGQAEVGPTRAVDIPGIVNYDEESAVYAFENTVLGGGTWWWGPGAV